MVQQFVENGDSLQSDYSSPPNPGRQTFHRDNHRLYR